MVCQVRWDRRARRVSQARKVIRETSVLRDRKGLKESRDRKARKVNLPTRQCWMICRHESARFMTLGVVVQAACYQMKQQPVSQVMRHFSGR